MIDVFLSQEIHILQNKKSEYHEMEQEREEAIHRLQVELHAEEEFAETLQEQAASRMH